MRALSVCCWLVCLVSTVSATLYRAVNDQGQEYITAHKRHAERAKRQTGNENTLSTPDVLVHFIHHDGPFSSYIAERANFIQDLARFLNSKNMLDDLYAYSPELDQEVRTSLNEICYADVQNVNCSEYNLFYRPITGACNNLQKPRYGTPNTAQIRLSEPYYEHAAQLIFNLNDSAVYVPLDPSGVDLFTNPVVMFSLKGSSPFVIGVVGSSPVCETATLESGILYSVQGVITSVEIQSPMPAQVFWCTFKLGVVYHQNQYTVATGCAATYNVCYHPVIIEAKISPQTGGYTSLRVGNDAVATVNPGPMFNTDEFQPFFLQISGSDLFLGQGAECIQSEHILSRPLPANADLPSQYDRFSLVVTTESGTVGQPDVAALYPVWHYVEVETDHFDMRQLDDVSSTYSQGFFRFGLQTFQPNTDVRIDLVDETLNARISVTMGTGGSFMSFYINDVQQSVIAIDVNVPNPNTFKTTDETLHASHSALWISFIGDVAKVGIGNIVGVNKISPPLPIGHPGGTFTPTRVQLHSNVRVSWILDLAQKGTPRQTSKSGRKLPTARDVSLAVHQNLNALTAVSPTHTIAVMQFGQFLDHDVILTPVEDVGGSHALFCCHKGKPVEPRSRFCYNVEITGKSDSGGSQGAFPYPTHECMPFTRSSAAMNCDPNHPNHDDRTRDVLNTITSYVDGSNIYGSHDADTRELRTLNGTGARLKTSAQGPKELPETEHPEEACNNAGLPSHYLCHDAGDVRVNEQPGLTSMHTLWMREHNRIVDMLVMTHGYPYSTVYDREILFQEARRLVIAEYQHIVYQEFLESFLDEDVFADYNLGPNACSYSPTTNPSVSNEFGIAFRMGHTWIHPSLNGANGFQLADHFFDPSLTYMHGSDMFIKNMYQAPCAHTDRIMENVITDHLFRNGSDALDLASLNIQRGRDHALNFCNARKAIGLPVPHDFEEAEAMGIFTAATIETLKDVYDCVCDIDLFTAVIAEAPIRDSKPNPTEKGVNGPLANHLIAEFFSRAKCGDRYYYEFPDSQFTPAQIAEIQKASLAKVICDNVLQDDTAKIQQNPFLFEGPNNPLVECGSIPSIDLSLFPNTYYRKKRSNDETVDERMEADIEELEENIRNKRNV